MERTLRGGGRQFRVGGDGHLWIMKFICRRTQHTWGSLARRSLKGEGGCARDTTGKQGTREYENRMASISARAILLTSACVSCMMCGCMRERDGLLPKLLRFEESVISSRDKVGSLPSCTDAREFIGVDPDVVYNMQAFRDLLAQKVDEDLCESVMESIVRRHKAR